MSDYVVMQAENLSQELIDEAIAQARRFDRNFANREGSDSIPVPARTCRLMALTILNFHKKLTQESQAEAPAESVSEEVAKPAKKRGRPPKNKL